MAACFTLLNVQFFTNLNLQINAVADPVDLQKIVDDAFAEIQLLESTITGQIALLEPILALLTVPGASLTAIISWIEGLINNVLTPLYIPYTTQVAQLAELAGQVATVIATIEEVAALKFPGITITIPTIDPNFCTI